MHSIFVMYLGIIFMFLRLRVCSATWIYWFIVFIESEKILAIISLNTFLSLPLLISKNMYIRMLQAVPEVTDTQFILSPSVLFIISTAISLSLLIFSSAMFNLPLILTRVFVISHISHLLEVQFGSFSYLL